MEILTNGNILSLLLKIFIDIITITVLVGVIYYPRNRDKDFVFTFIVFNVLVFLVCYYMSRLDMELGFAFGLFALFSILRYRTIVIPIKEMTYLFTAIVVAIINSIGSSEVNLLQLIVSNVVIIGVIFYLETVWLKTQQGFKVIKYENLKLIKLEQRPELIADLRARTGLAVTEVEVESIDFLNDTAVIKIYYDVKGSGVRRIVDKRMR